MKMLISYVAHLASLPEFKGPGGDDLTPQMVCTCAYTLAKFIEVLDASKFWLPKAKATEAANAGRLYLQCWQWLSADSIDKRTFNFHTRPKHHYFDHHVEHVRVRRMNPRLMSCLLGEDLLGKIKRMARATHAKSTRLRFRQRYLLFLDERWSKASHAKKRKRTD